MLVIRMISPDILEVTQQLLSFQHTKRSYFYTNIKTWEDLTNPTASEQTDNFKVTRLLSESAIRWAKQYYLPNVVNKEKFNVPLRG